MRKLIKKMDSKRYMNVVDRGVTANYTLAIGVGGFKCRD